MSKIIKNKQTRRVALIFAALYSVAIINFLWIDEVEAARLILDTKSVGVAQGDEFLVNLVLDSKDKEVNAIEGVIQFSSDVATLSRVSDGGSIVSFWVHNPGDKENQQRGVVNFSGVIPGGFAGGSGKLFSLVFKAAKSGMLSIGVEKVQAFENNGSGDRVETTTQNLSISVTKQIGNPVVVSEGLADKNPPEVFEPQIAQDKSLYDGKWFIVFGTTDKDSGIDRYEVTESGREDASDDQWTLATSPYVLKDQNSSKPVFVRSIDLAGNVRIAKVERHFSTNFLQKGYLSILFWIILVLSILFGVLVLRRKIAMREPRL